MEFVSFRLQKWGGDISDFRISGQSLVKENWHNSRTSGDIDIKLGQVTKLHTGIKKTLKKIDDDIC